MFNTLKAAVVAGLVGLSTLATPANADDLYLNFGGYSGSRFGVYLGDGGYMYHPRYHRDEFRTERRCTPERALSKARRIGIDRARVDFVTGRRIGIVGRSQGQRVKLIFARSPRCPIIR